ncbi:MAG TPA: hypothetical protein VHE30_09900 [Polyangiaceae bacterium]|nr:hypothetical protein [Polyangiaceae bacterium]
MLATFVLLAVLLSVRARTPVHAAFAAIAIGLAANVKESGAALLLPFVVLFLVRGRPRWCLTAIFAPVTFTLVSMTGLALGGEHAGPLDAWRTATRIVLEHATTTSFSHPMTSHWYTWLVQRRPIPLDFVVSAPGTVRTMNSIGNLLLWWSASVVFVLTPFPVLVTGLRAPARAWLPGALSPTATLFTAALSLMLPWMLGRVDSYVYHYLPSYTLLLVALGGLVARVERRAPTSALAFVGGVAVVSAFYAPVWTGAELSAAAYTARLFVPGWR